MKIALLRETLPGEARVALVPESIRKLVTLKATVSVESGAGIQAGASDADYEAAGASVSTDRASLLSSADVLAVVNRPSPEDIENLKQGAVVLGFLRPL
ncbi:MAG: NAD(P)(+) transhydrogenase (Re/Si-specific) subunit alpha, partial [Acidobacteria bacterium]|nr:NAD(P)(+) transhydrogenase (Re/Si-specific) subunit alpha [Acidobacteriota bacterium]